MYAKVSISNGSKVKAEANVDNRQTDVDKQTGQKQVAPTIRSVVIKMSFIVQPCLKLVASF